VASLHILLQANRAFDTLPSPSKFPHFTASRQVVLIGDSGVGKSNLLSRFTRNE
jgi:GTPase SAR1 family protein